jgi:hypothetical protein
MDVWGESTVLLKRPRFRRCPLSLALRLCALCLKTVRAAQNESFTNWFFSLLPAQFVRLFRCFPLLNIGTKHLMRFFVYSYCPLFNPNFWYVAYTLEKSLSVNRTFALEGADKRVSSL